MSSLDVNGAKFVVVVEISGDLNSKVAAVFETAFDTFQCLARVNQVINKHPLADVLASDVALNLTGGVSPLAALADDDQLLLQQKGQNRTKGDARDSSDNDGVKLSELERLLGQIMAFAPVVEAILEMFGTTLVVTFIG